MSLVTETWGWVAGIIMLAVTTSMTSMVQSWIAKFGNRLKQIRAKARVESEPYYKPGSIVLAAFRDGVAEPWIENYFIAEISVGRMLLRTVDGGAALPMTNAEFEDLHVIIDETREFDFYTQTTVPTAKRRL